MKIRSITYFIDPKWPLQPDRLAQAAQFIERAQQVYRKAGYQVQTTRLASIPFPYLFSGLSSADMVEAAQQLEAAASAHGFTYLSLGPALIDQPQSFELVPELINATKNTFCAAEMANRSSGVSLPAVRACAEIIQQIASLDANGFANLYFAALANVPPGSPFFPASYHQGEQPAFAIATEAADLAVQVFSQAQSLNQGVTDLVSIIERHAGKLAAAGEKLEQYFSVRSGGIDFSLAPFPQEESSLGTAIEELGVPAVGQHGSLAAAAILTSALDQADFPHTGFSGLFMPLLEDFTLAKRAAQGYLTGKDLLMYASVCGTGLDTIPLPGDTSAEQMTPLLLDLAALALRLDKPLTARLMPIPGKQAGEATGFDFPFFANSRILALDSQPLKGYLAGGDSFNLKVRAEK